MESRFEIFSYSKNRMALLMFVSLVFILIFTIIGGSLFGKIGLYICGCLGILLCFINYFITPKYFAKSVVEIYCNTNGFIISFIKPFYGSKLGTNISIRLNELISYKFESTNNFSTIRFTLKNGTKYKIHRWYNDNNDQFDKFLVQFEKNINTYNKKKSLEIIKKEKSIFENRFFAISVAVILISLFVLTILLLLTREIQNKSGFIFILIFFAPLIWIINQIFNSLRK